MQGRCIQRDARCDANWALGRILRLSRKTWDILRRSLNWLLRANDWIGYPRNCIFIPYSKSWVIYMCFCRLCQLKKSSIVWLHSLYQASYYFAHAATFRSFFKSQATTERAVFRRSLWRCMEPRWTQTKWKMWKMWQALSVQQIWFSLVLCQAQNTTPQILGTANCCSCGLHWSCDSQDGLVKFRRSLSLFGSLGGNMG